VSSIAILFVLMLFVYVLTFIVPGGEYGRIVDSNGDTIIDTQGGFKYVDGGISFIKWVLSPILVLTVDGSSTIMAVIGFLLVAGGIFNTLEKSGLMKYILERIAHKMSKNKYTLMGFIIFFFMLLGAMIGSFEECVPLVPIVVALAISLGWDDLTGLGMSLLAVGCGFASGVCNPFTVGIAQEIAGITMFSGIWFRILCFVIIYIILTFFVYCHAKSVEKPVNDEALYNDFKKNKKFDLSSLLFVIIFGIGIVIVLCSVFITFLQDLTMVIIAIMFLIAGLVSVLVLGMKPTEFVKWFGYGVVSVLPAVLLILMASSVKYTLIESNMLDTLLFYGVKIAEKLPGEAVVIFIYLIVLVMNFFVSSGSAKAFLMIPLIVPIGQIFDISSQICITAFAFGDGFTNVLYPTNPVLLISLGLVNVSYTKWLKWTWRFQLVNFIITGAMLLYGLMIGY